MRPKTPQRHKHITQALHRLILASAFVFASLAACAQGFQITGRVVNVIDGDTVDVLTAANAVQRIRLSSIDAPERAQPFGQRSKQNLAGLIANTTVTAYCSKMQAHTQGQRARALCKVYRNDRDINLAQVQSGFAWHYTMYAREQPAAERIRYVQAEGKARASRRGLWIDTEPIAPWDWRRF